MKFKDFQSRYQLDFQRNELNLADILRDILELKKKVNHIEREMYTKLFSEDFDKFQNEVLNNYITKKDMDECYEEITNNKRYANSQHKGLEESVQINYRQFKSY